MDEKVTGQISDFIRKVLKGEENSLDLAVQALEQSKDPKTGEVIPGGSRVVIALQNRELLPEAPRDPVKAESPMRAHTFHDPIGFVSYLLKYGGEGTVVLADATKEVVCAVLDEKAPRGFEVVAFRPQRHPLFTPWLAMLAKWMPLRQAVDFLLDNRRTITEPDGKLLARDLSQIKVASNVTRMQGIGTHSINGVMVETTLSGQKKEQPMELPEEITIDVPMFVGCDPLPLTMDVSIDHSEEHGVLFRMSSPDILVKSSQQFDQFCRTIVTGLDGKGCVSLGSVGHTDWKVLR